MQLCNISDNFILYIFKYLLPDDLLYISVLCKNINRLFDKRYDNYWKNIYKSNITIDDILLNKYKDDKEISIFNICLIENLNLCMKCKEIRYYDKYNEKFICCNCNNIINTDITFTEAKKVFYLNDNDLLDMSYKSVNNPYYRSSSPMRLYNLLDIYNQSQKKYINEENYTLFIIRKNNKKIFNAIRNQTKKRDNILKKRKILKLELNKYKLDLRTDSRLCEKYINTSSKLIIEDIIYEMCLMKYLYEYTNYSQRISNMYKKYKKKYYNYYHNNTDAIENSYIIKGQILKEHGGKWPDNPWIWLKDENNNKERKNNKYFSYLEENQDGKTKIIDIWRKYKKMYPTDKQKQKDFYIKLENNCGDIIKKGSTKYLYGWTIID